MKLKNSYKHKTQHIIECFITYITKWYFFFVFRYNKNEQIKKNMQNIIGMIN